jgi:DNA-binding NtrC family response regulator
MKGTYVRWHDIVAHQSNTRTFGALIGSSVKMEKVFSMIEKAARYDIPVLIVGETGTGKELVAREVHVRSHRSSGPFVAVNTGALNSELIASELFGHNKGSFTGAIANKIGHYEEADGGTLFLDEVATMEERMQVALLRILETGAFRPIGAKRDRTADVRIVAATNEELDNAVRDGRFRDDLLHRFQVFRINLPPLRDHLEDIPMLVCHFLNMCKLEFDFEVTEVDDATIECLRSYEWPGNVRELKNVIAQACLMADDGCLLPEHLPPRIARSIRKSDPVPGSTSDGQPQERRDDAMFEGSVLCDTDSRATQAGQDGVFVPLGLSLEEVQKTYILKTLLRYANNKTQAAKVLGVSRKTLYDKLVRWGIGL